MSEYFGQYIQRVLRGERVALWMFTIANYLIASSGSIRGLDGGWGALNMLEIRLIKAVPFIMVAMFLFLPAIEIWADTNQNGIERTSDHDFKW